MMRISKSIFENTSTLKLSGSFIFQEHRNFTDSYKSLLEGSKINTIAVDLSEIDYLDSAALGMLLLLKETAAAKKVGVTLVRPTGNVKKIIEIANFNKLFQIL